MKKLMLLLLFTFTTLLLAENDLSELEIAETISEAEYQKIIAKSLSNIDTEYFSVPIGDSSTKVEADVTVKRTPPPQENKTPDFISYAEAVVKAKEENKMILLEVVLDNCKFCEKMERLVLSKKNVQDAIAKHFVFSQINADREPLPLNLSEQMSPMFVFISKSENVKDMRFGYIEEDDFLKLVVEQSKNWSITSSKP